MKLAGRGSYRRWIIGTAAVLAVLAVVLIYTSIRAPLETARAPASAESVPPPAPAASTTSAPTSGGAAAPVPSAPAPGATDETAGSSYSAGESGSSYPPAGTPSGGSSGPGVAYDMSPEGAGPPTPSQSETAAAPPPPHRAKAPASSAAQRAAAERMAAELAANEQARRAVEEAQEQGDQASAAQRREERVGSMEGSGGSAPPRRVAKMRIGVAPPPPPPPVIVVPRVAAAAPRVIVGAAAPPPPAIALPEFPWPPPPPSDRMMLSRAGFARGLGANPSLMSAADHLTDALGQAGYSQYSFYSAPGGFALVARLERIRSDGTPEPEGQRFAPPSASEPFSLGVYLKQLFIAPEGYYRLIVFVVTDNVVVTKGAAPTAATAQAWLRNGADRLPAAYATLPFTKAHEVDALIYEFRKEGKGQATPLTPSPIDARAHLERAGLYALLVGGAGH